MCERCAFAGCRHDWQRWTPREYDEGYGDGYHDRANRHQNYQDVARSGYEAGFVAGQIDRGRRETEAGR